MSKLVGAVIDFWTWAFVLRSWMLNLTPRSFSACAWAPAGHSTPRLIIFRVPVYASLASPRPAFAAAGRRGLRCRERCRAEASLDQQLAPRHTPPPRLRGLGPDDIRVRVVPRPSSSEYPS